MRDRELADLAADVALSQPELLASGYRDYQRYRVTLTGADGAPVAQVRDILRAGKVVAVLPVDLARDEIVLIRQFRLPAHLANGRGSLLEAVAGRVEPGESLRDAARRECTEEIGVAPTALVELFSFLTTPGLTDEEVTVFLAAVDAARVPERSGAASEGEQIRDGPRLHRRGTCGAQRRRDAQRPARHRAAMAGAQSRPRRRAAGRARPRPVKPVTCS